MTTLEPNFKIPLDYHRTFMLEDDGYQLWLVVDKDGIHYGSSGKGVWKKRTAKVLSQELDWMQWAVAQVRQELEP